MHVNNGAELLQKAVNYVSATWGNFISHKNLKFEIKTFESDKTSSFIKKTGRDSYHVFVPTGLGYRTFLLGVLLYNFPMKDGMVKHVVSPTDIRDIKTFIPTKLKQIFDHSEPIKSDIGSLLTQKWSDTAQNSMRDQVVFLALCLNLYHELAHAILGHHDFFRFAETHSIYADMTLGMSRNDILEGMEVAADIGAGHFLSVIVTQNLDGMISSCEDHPTQNPAHLFSDFNTCIAMLVCLFDVRNRSFDVKGAGYYPHPAIRYRVIVNAMSEILVKHKRASDLASIVGKSIESLIEESSEKTAHFVSTLISQSFFDEIGEDEKDGLDVPESFLPISPLTLDKGPFGRSVYRDYYQRSLESGRRVEALIWLRRLNIQESGSPFIDSQLHMNDTTWKSSLEKIEKFGEPTT